MKKILLVCVLGLLGNSMHAMLDKKPGGTEGANQQQLEKFEVINSLVDKYGLDQKLDLVEVCTFMQKFNIA